ncbi:hypothetical protein Vadar_005449 [Vaccinium darrowii]|uniref:Uncharacterized protein n=1 Tax=Vaccinium darrowii TaxID=229202 RepID=A0ACB7Z2I3_9ERIC|nr:hypothetical protein Vadar_005449 [Vaccinium darrowii]
MPFSSLMIDGLSTMSANGICFITFPAAQHGMVINVYYAVKVGPRLPLPPAKVEEGSAVAVGLLAVGLGKAEEEDHKQHHNTTQFSMQLFQLLFQVLYPKLQAKTGKAFGMTGFITPDESNEPVSDLLKEIIGGMEGNYCIECTGAVALVQEALEASKPLHI